jgi:pimeloyl-ACP methyl ester carboxylesterase
MKKIIPLITSLIMLLTAGRPAIANPADTITHQSGYARINGLNMYYEVHGKGRGMPLVLIHGGGSTIETTFGAILPLLAMHREVIAMELQGQGHTSDRDTLFRFEQDADDIAALLAYLGVKKADFFGFSNGGNAGIQVAVRHPELVHKLVAGSVFYRKDGWVPGLEQMFRQASEKNMPPVLRQAYMEASPHPERLPIQVSKLMARLLHFEDWPPDMLRAIKVPVLIMAGNQDVATIEHTAALYRLFPQGQLAIFPGGHGGYIGEVTARVAGSRMPERTVALIEEFLDQPAGRGN